MDVFLFLETHEKSFFAGKHAFGDASVSGIGGSPTAALASFYRLAQCVDIAPGLPWTHPCRFIAPLLSLYI